MNPSLHPNPLLERAHWQSLDGAWRFAYDDAGCWEHPSQVEFKQTIQVPYPPESPASGIHDTGFHPVVWYSLGLEAPVLKDTERLLLHFGAVDYAAKVWANGQLVAQHQGGQTPFVADLTQQARSGHLEIAVRAEDNPHDLAQPRGKQDWEAQPHGIWHYRVSGIWQTVWLETVPATRIEKLHWTPDLQSWGWGLEVEVAGAIKPGLSLRVSLSLNGTPLAQDRYAVLERRLTRTIRLGDPGVDEARAYLLWSPEHPQLIEARLELIEEATQTVVDSVGSYTALRSVGTGDGHFWLNGRPYYLRMALDQGYWTEGLYTASEAQLERDVVLAKALGFNGLRKHQKLENPRWLYHCDRLGMLVWGEMPSHYAFTPSAIQALTGEWLEALERDRSHPCIVAWVPFNESWGVPDLPNSLAQRDYVEGIYKLTKALDPSRPVSGNDGWEQHASDFFNIHDYTIQSEALLQRYRDSSAVLESLHTVRPLGRSFGLHGTKPDGRPVIFSEFGAYVDHQSTVVGLDRKARDPEHLLELYTELMRAVYDCKGFAGFCYTQLTDVYYERNGLLDMQRQPKADLAGLAAATRGEFKHPALGSDKEV